MACSKFGFDLIQHLGGLFTQPPRVPISDLHQHFREIHQFPSQTHVQHEVPHQDIESVGRLLEDGEVNGVINFLHDLQACCLGFWHRLLRDIVKVVSLVNVRHPACIWSLANLAEELLALTSLKPLIFFRSLDALSTLCRYGRCCSNQVRDRIKVLLSTFLNPGLPLRRGFGLLGFGGHLVLFPKGIHTDVDVLLGYEGCGLETSASDQLRNDSPVQASAGGDGFVGVGARFRI